MCTILALFNMLYRRSSIFALAIAACSLVPLSSAFARPQDDAVAKVAQPVPDNTPDTIKPMPEPELSAAVRQLLEADYLKDAERAALRVNHGAWETSDLSIPSLRAVAAVIRGDWQDASLTDESVPPVERADAAFEAGRPGDAISLLTGVAGIRAARIRGDALLATGKLDQALAEFRAGVTAAADPALKDADEVAEGVRCGLVLARWEPKAAPSYQQLLAMIARSRDELDRVGWRANLVEAMLLYEKEKFSDVAATVSATLSLNPKCAQAYWIYGQMCVDTFDFPRAERIAARLDELAAPSPSVYGACIRAYLRQRQNEGEAAMAQLDRAFQAYPKCALILAYRAASAATEFNFEKTDAMLAEYDAAYPRSPLALYVVGRAMSGSRQYEEAARYLGKATQLAPNWATPVVELGLSELQAGRNAESLAALEKAMELDPLNRRGGNSLALLRDMAKFTSVESEHFIVRCTPGLDQVVAGEMLDPLEGIYKRVTGSGTGGIDHAPKGKTVVELYPDHRSFGVRITGMPELHTIAAATGPVIAMEAPREGAGHMGAFDWRRVVQHEYTHTVTLSRTKNRLPHWFTEASAVYLEDAPRDYSTVRLLAMAYETDTLFDLDTINIMFVRPRRPTDRMQAYAQGHMMYEYIIDTFGADKPLKLMDLYASGVREAAAFSRVLGVEREQFLPGFKIWTRGRLEKWGMIPTQAHPDIKQLLEREKADAAGNPTPAPKDAQGEAGAEPDAPKDGPERVVIDPPAPARGEGATLAQTDAWLAQSPENPFILEQKLKFMIKDSGGDATEEMIPMLRRYAAARPVDPLPHKLLAAYLLAHDRGDEAVEDLEYLDIREQHSPGFAEELAHRYASRGDMEKASAKAARATQIAPYDATYREYAANLAIRMKNFTLAKRHLDALVALEPDRELHRKRRDALGKMMAEGR